MAKRANGEGSLRRRSDGRWEARYYSPIDNKQHSLYGKTQKEIKEKLRKKLNELDENAVLEGDDMLVSTWLDIWLKNYTSNLKPLTQSTYLSTIETHLKPNIGDKTLRTLTTNDIQKIYVDLLKNGRSAKTIKNTHGVMHKTLEQAVKLHYIKYNVSEACVLPKVMPKEINPLDEDNIIDFLDAIKGDPYEQIYFVTLFTGMRQGEVLGLTWDNIDFNENIIYLNKQLIKKRDGSNEFYFGTLKNGKSRVIYISQIVANVLKDRKRIQSRDRRAAGAGWLAKGQFKNLVFTNEFGEHLVHHTVYKHYKKIVKSIGIEESRFHDLRHSFAVISLQNGDDIKTVQESLGHHTSTFTLQVYAHSTRRMKTESARRMDDYIQGII